MGGKHGIVNLVHLNLSCKSERWQNSYINNCWKNEKYKFSPKLKMPRLYPNSPATFLPSPGLFPDHF